MKRVSIKGMQSIQNRKIRSRVLRASCFTWGCALIVTGICVESISAQNEENLTQKKSSEKKSVLLTQEESRNLNRKRYLNFPASNSLREEYQFRQKNKRDIYTLESLVKKHAKEIGGGQTNLAEIKNSYAQAIAAAYVADYKRAIEIHFKTGEKILQLSQKLLKICKSKTDTLLKNSTKKVAYAELENTVPTTTENNLPSNEKKQLNSSIRLRKAYYQVTRANHMEKDSYLLEAIKFHHLAQLFATSALRSLAAGKKQKQKYFSSN